jgi:hypothetical protein
MTVGRNDLCPCGSGKKFKRCCLGRDGAAARPFTETDRDSALAALARFAERGEFEADRETAALAFWADRLDGHRPDEVPAAQKESDYAFTMWFGLDYPLARGGTVADGFMAREGGRLLPGEREYLRRMQPTSLRLYEVVEVRPDEGLTLLDCWTDERRWVRERLGTRQLVRWDVLATRLMPGADGDPVIDGATHLYPAADKEEVLKALRRAHRAFRRRFPGADLAAFFKHAGPVFHHLWLDLVALRPLPRLVTAEGDPVLLARAVFDVADREGLRAALAGHPELDEDEEGRYAWRAPEDVNGFRRSLGTFVLEGDRLAFEAMSLARAERGRRLLEGVAGDAVRYRATRCQDIRQALSETPAPREPRPPEIPPEVEAQLAFEFYDRHYRTWPDTPVPALGNRTPREAARLDAIRPRLVALLKDFEARAERQRREGRPAYDFAWLWGELGLARPE